MVINNPTAPCICCHTTFWNINVRKQAIDDKLQCTVLHIYGVVGLLITKLRQVYCWVCQWIFFNRWIFGKVTNKNVVISCIFVFFVFYIAVCWPGIQSGRDNHVLARSFAEYSPIKNVFTDRLSNKPFLIWLLTTPPHPKHVATLPCNLSFIACFLT